MHKVLCVSAFRDIGRGGWNGRHAEWKRTTNEYMEWFTNLTKAPIDLICFCDEPLIQEMGKTFPYDESDTFFKFIEKEKEIMNNEYYKTSLGRRIRHPEHSIPEYNLVQHSKTSFIRRARTIFPEYTHYAWIDFGYIRESRDIPLEVVWDTVTTDKIHYASFPIPDVIPDPLSLCQIAPQVIQGSMFILPNELAEWYEKEYEAMLMEYHRLGLTDDDQALVLQIFKKFPEKFVLHQIHEWFGIFRHLLRK